MIRTYHQKRKKTFPTSPFAFAFFVLSHRIIGLRLSKSRKEKWQRINSSDMSPLQRVTNTNTNFKLLLYSYINIPHRVASKNYKTPFCSCCHVECGYTTRHDTSPSTCRLVFKDFGTEQEHFLQFTSFSLAFSQVVGDIT